MTSLLLIHRFNAFLKATRGVARAELADGVHDHIYAVEVPYCNPANVADIASVTYVEGSSIARGADGNNVIAPKSGWRQLRGRCRGLLLTRRKCILRSSPISAA